MQFVLAKKVFFSCLHRREFSFSVKIMLIQHKIDYCFENIERMIPYEILFRLSYECVLNHLVWRLQMAFVVTLSVPGGTDDVIFVCALLS